MKIGKLHELGLHSGIDEDTDFIPLLSAEDEDNMRNEQIPDVLPILPLRNTVLFPGVVIPITVGRDKSIQLIKDYNKSDKTIGVVAQKSDSVEEPGEIAARARRDGDDPGGQRAADGRKGVRMQVESLHPGVTLEEVQAETGFELLVREPLATTPAPDDISLATLRNEVDPHRYIIGRG